MGGGGVRCQLHEQDEMPEMVVIAICIVWMIEQFIGGIMIHGLHSFTTYATTSNTLVNSVIDYAIVFGIH